MTSYSAMVSTIGTRFSYTPSTKTPKQRNIIPSLAPAPHQRRGAALVVMAEVGINQEIRKSEDKVIDSIVVSELSKPLTAYCRCWRSGTFPLCDGSHVKHNKATGDNVGPLLVKKSKRRMAAKEEVKVLGFPASPYVARARIALNLKGVEYEFLIEDLAKKSDLLLKSNPVYKKVPVLIHGGKPVCESLIIVQYIDEVWAAAGPPILPADSFGRSVARFWAVYIDDKLPARTSVFLGEADEAARAEAKQEMLAALQQLDEVFAKCSEGKSFFGGDTIGYIDIALGSYLGWLKALEKIAGIKLLDAEKIPRLVEWAERFCGDDAVKEVIPETDELVEFSKVLREAFKAAASSSN